MQKDIFSQSRCSHCGGSHPTEKCSKKQIKDKVKNKSIFNSRKFNNKRTERDCWEPNTCFRCGSEDHFIANFPKPDTSDKKCYWNMENPKTCAYRSNKIYKTLDNCTDQSDSQNMCASMSHMSSNTEIPWRYFGYSSQLTKWILDSGATCHITPEISYFIPGSLVKTDKYISVAHGNFITEK